MRLLDPIHPGDILLEEFMRPLELSINRLARDLHVPANRISGIVNRKRSITTDTALRLGRYFKTSAELWMGLQSEYDMRVARRSLERQINREVRPLKRTSEAA
jgi:addiction module HigA family antidote